MPIELAREVCRVVREQGFEGQASDLQRSIEAAVEPARPANGAVDSAARRGGRRAAARHVAPALHIARAGVMASLATQLQRLVVDLCWTQTESYVARPPYRGFLDHYAHAAVLGPADTAPLAEDPTATTRLGILLLGPHHAYPHHTHPADEIYVPLTTARWSAGRLEHHQPRPAGTAIYHRPEQPHAVETEATPLLAVYLWTGGISSAARFCD